jgi:hypothetical protein
MSLTIDTIVNILATVASVSVAVAGLGFWLGKKFTEIDYRFKLVDERFKAINERFSSIEKEIRTLRDAIIQYNELLLSILESRGVVTRSEAAVLRGYLASLKPSASSKYYTKEVEKRLDELLAKEPEQLTLADVQELNKIGDLIWLEGYERDDEFLREYGMKLKIYATLVKVLFIYPKIAKLKEGLLGLKEEVKQEKKT